MAFADDLSKQPKADAAEVKPGDDGEGAQDPHQSMRLQLALARRKAQREEERRNKTPESGKEQPAAGQAQQPAAAWHANYGKKLTSDGKTDFADYKDGLGPLQASSEYDGGAAKKRVLKGPVTRAELLQMYDTLKLILKQKPELTAKVDEYLLYVNESFRLMKIDTVEAQAAFLANAYAETGQFQHFTEGQRPSTFFEDAPDKVKLDDQHFEDLAEGKVKLNNNQQVDSKAYSKHGSIRGEADSWKDAFIGRGAVQVTHRHLYVECIAILEKESEALAAMPGREADAKKLKKAADEIKENPQNAGKAENAMLISAAYMKRKNSEGKAGDEQANKGSATSWMGSGQPEKPKKDAVFEKARKILEARLKLEEEAEPDVGVESETKVA